MKPAERITMQQQPPQPAVRSPWRRRLIAAAVLVAVAAGAGFAWRASRRPP